MLSVFRTPTLNETLPKRVRHKTTRVHSRFGNDDDVCGYQSFVPKIRGGEIANIDEFPWMAMLLYELSELSQKKKTQNIELPHRHRLGDV